MDMYLECKLPNDAEIFYWGTPEGLEDFNESLRVMERRGYRPLSMPELLEAKLEAMEMITKRSDIPRENDTDVLDRLKTIFSKKRRFSQAIMASAMGRIMGPYSHFLGDRVYSSEGLIYSPGELPVMARVSPLIEMPDVEYTLIGESADTYEKRGRMAIPYWERAASISPDEGVYERYRSIAREDEDKKPDERRAMVLQHRETFSVPLDRESEFSTFLLGTAGVHLGRILHERTFNLFKSYCNGRANPHAIRDLLRGAKNASHMKVDLINPKIIDRQEAEVISGVSLEGIRTINARKFNDSWMRGIDTTSAKKLMREREKREEKFEADNEEWVHTYLRADQKS